MQRGKGKEYDLIFKYLWVLIIIPKAYQFVLLFCYTMYLLYTKSYKIKVDTFSKICFIYASIHIASILINSLEDILVYRIVAAVNTALIWVVATSLYVIFLNSNVSIERISKYCFMNSTLLFLLLIIARTMLRTGKHQFALPYLNSALYWQEGYYSRFTGCMEYPTLIVPFTMLMLPGALYYINMKLGKRLERGFLCIIMILYYCLCCIPIYFCYSRVGYVLMLVGGGLTALFAIKTRLTYNSWKLFSVVLIICVGVGLITILKVNTTIIDRLLNMREGSNSTRMTIYKESLMAFISKPFWGCGIKNIGSTGLPLGSHSTYIGFLFKTGIIGTLVILTGFFIQIKGLLEKLKKGCYCEKLSIIFMLLIFAFAILEDIDGVDWLICLFFSLLGIINSVKSQEMIGWKT